MVLTYPAGPDRAYQQRFYGQERHLPAALDRPTHRQRPELITGLADR
jgi:hypothetical protein